ncbi:MAG: glycosyltransferase [Muribaculaceae bacterium]|nr:glycosyltransferase [Muribaculaceae bacterium]
MNTRPSHHRPLLSIITVCYNAADTIRPTLESVDRQELSDSRSDSYEHLIIDGASTDGTLDIVADTKNPRRYIMSEPDGGIYLAMNKGLSQAHGEYVMFLNAGDRLHGTNALSRIMDAVGGIVLPGVIYGQTDIVDKDGRRIGPRHLRAPKVLNLGSFKEGMVVCHQAFIALTRIAEPFDTRFRFSADYDWCIRCLQHSRRNIYLGDEPIIDYLSEGTTTRNRGASLKERFKIMSHYYGPVPTLIRHIGFVFRLLGARKGSPRN